MKELAKRIIFGSLPIDANKERLTAANQILTNEMNKLNKEVQRIGYRTDPIDEIIRNIKKVKMKNGSGH